MEMLSGFEIPEKRTITDKCSDTRSRKDVRGEARRGEPGVGTLNAYMLEGEAWMKGGNHCASRARTLRTADGAVGLQT